MVYSTLLLVWNPECTAWIALKNPRSWAYVSLDSDIPSLKQVPLCRYDKLEEAINWSNIFSLRVSLWVYSEHQVLNRKLLIYCNWCECVCVCVLGCYIVNMIYSFWGYREKNPILVCILIKKNFVHTYPIIHKAQRIQNENYQNIEGL